MNARTIPGAAFETATRLHGCDWPCVPGLARGGSEDYNGRNRTKARG